MNYITVIKTIIGIFPLIVQAIVSIEAAFPQSGKGALKLDLLKTVLSGSAEISEDMDAGRFEEVWPAIVKVVGTIVSITKQL